MSFYKREDPDPEDWTPHHSGHKARTCRGCGAILAHGDKFSMFNGWSWCLEPCYREVVALAMAGTEQAADAEEFFNRVRR